MDLTHFFSFFTAQSSSHWHKWESYNWLQMGIWACLRPWHGKLMLWRLVETSYYIALSHKYTFTNSGTSIWVSLWKQTSLCGKYTFPCNFHSSSNAKDKISCCHNLLHWASVTNYEARFCDVSCSRESPNPKIQPSWILILWPNSFFYSSSNVQAYLSN